MKVQDAVMEAFDQVYRVRRTNSNEFSFTTDKGNQYQISFYRPSHPSMFLSMQEDKIGKPLPDGLVNVADVDFTFVPEGGGSRYKYMGGTKMVDSMNDNALKIYATVMSTIFWYTENERLDALFFSGEMKLGSLYQKMVRRYVPNGYKAMSGSYHNSIHFCVWKDK